MMYMLTEKEKMLSGVPYHADDRQLMQERDTAKDQLFDLQQLRPSSDLNA